jgi:hypothetical protein
VTAAIDNKIITKLAARGVLKVAAWGDFIRFDTQVAMGDCAGSSPADEDGEELDLAGRRREADEALGWIHRVGSQGPGKTGGENQNASRHAVDSRNG